MARKRMTHDEAVTVLLNAALSYCEGSGVGLRAVPTDAEKARIVRAAERLWPETGHQFPLDNSYLYRFGLALSRPAPETDSR